MLLRAIGRSAKNLVSVRNIALSRASLGGGGHHHEPTPVYTPKPGSLDWYLCGNNKKSAHEPEPYIPKGDDYGSFVGAAVFVGLTIAAVLFKTDAFKKDTHVHHHVQKHETSHESSSHAEPAHEPEPEEVEAVAPEPVASTSSPSSEPTPVAAQTSEESAQPSTSSQSEPAPVQQETPEVSTPTPEPVSQSSESSASSSSPSSSSPSTESTPQKSEEASNESDEKKKGLYCEYVIIGSGTAAYYASLAIRAKQAEAKVLMIGEENELPYNRPPLSKELWWYGDENSSKKLDYTALSGKKRDIFYEVEGFFVKPEDLPSATHGGVSLIRGSKVVKICEEDKTVILEDGTTIGFGKVLIATGTRPKKMDLFEKSSNEVQNKITYYHYPADFKKVENSLADSTVKTITIIGNSLIASELAYSIKRKYENVNVHQIFEEKYNASDILPEHLAKKSTEAIQKMGVNVHSEEKIGGVRKCCKNVVLTMKDGSEHRTDLIVIADGEDVNSELAEASGLKINSVNGGVTTDKYLKVSPNIYAAGSVASFDDSVLGTRRLSSWENAQISGRLAGENMVLNKNEKDEKAFWYQPSFFTKFAPHLHLNAIGQIDSKLETVAVYAEPEKDSQIERAVVFYKSKNGGHIVGVLLVNVFGPSLDVARRIIDDRKNIEDLKELAKLFPLYEAPKADE
ncbi:unnamed protein product [Caenorhabditis angaria]|uniref:FAD/NAD(P)-binding domain-containing protein n=1 Tax=Caenorhabditis angaria TaxID=860376 RepID=A0A9P1IK20_9PELO|nr:unnamed protein product [Caenorhabditis angaria]